MRLGVDTAYQLVKRCCVHMPTLRRYKQCQKVSYVSSSSHGRSILWHSIQQTGYTKTCGIAKWRTNFSGADLKCGRPWRDDVAVLSFRPEYQVTLRSLQQGAHLLFHTMPARIINKFYLLRHVTWRVVRAAPCLFQHGGRRRSSSARV